MNKFIWYNINILHDHYSHLYMYFIIFSHFSHFIRYLFPMNSLLGFWFTLFHYWVDRQTNSSFRVIGIYVWIVTKLFPSLNIIFKDVLITLLLIFVIRLIAILPFSSHLFSSSLHCMLLIILFIEFVPIFYLIIQTFSIFLLRLLNNFRPISHISFLVTNLSFIWKRMTIEVWILDFIFSERNQSFF